jgi:ATP:ADP antiporter, AAA family
LRDSEKISNAIEVVELSLPYKIFNQLNALVEFYIDVNQTHSFIPVSRASYKTRIIGEILKDERVSFGTWTKSIACYILPLLKKNELSLTILKSVPTGNNFLFAETKKHILTVLK